MKAPLLSAYYSDVFSDDPVLGLAWMSSERPPAHRMIDSTIYGGKDLFADDMPMIARPATDQWVEQTYQVSGCGLFVVFDDFSNLLQEGRDVLLGRLDQ